MTPSQYHGDRADEGNRPTACRLFDACMFYLDLFGMPLVMATGRQEIFAAAASRLQKFTTDLDVVDYVRYAFKQHRLGHRLHTVLASAQTLNKFYTYAHPSLQVVQCMARVMKQDDHIFRKAARAVDDVAIHRLLVLDGPTYRAVLGAEYLREYDERPLAVPAASHYDLRKLLPPPKFLGRYKRRHSLSALLRQNPQ